MPITVESPRAEAGESLYKTEEKLFDDIRANPGEKAFIFIHSVPFEGSVSLVNLLTSTRLVRKGFDVSIILYGPGVMLASRHRGYPTVGTEGFPGNLAGNRQIETLIRRAPRSTPAGSRWERCTGSARKTSSTGCRRSARWTSSTPPSPRGALVPSSSTRGPSDKSARGCRQACPRPPAAAPSAEPARRVEVDQDVDGSTTWAGCRASAAPRRRGPGRRFAEPLGREGVRRSGLLAIRAAGANLHAFRHAIERVPPAQYLSGYYGRWLDGRAEPA